MSKRSVRFLSVVLSSLLLGSNVCTFAGKAGDVGNIRRSRSFRKSSGFCWGKCALGAAGLVTLEEVVRRCVFNGVEKGKSGKKVVSPAPEKKVKIGFIDDNWCLNFKGEGMREVGVCKVKAAFAVFKKRFEDILEYNYNAPEPKTAECEPWKIYKSIKVSNVVVKKDEKFFSANVSVSARDYKGDLLCLFPDSSVHFELFPDKFYSDSYCFVINEMGFKRNEQRCMLKLANNTFGIDVESGGVLTVDQDIHFAWLIAEYFACKRLGEEGGDCHGALSDQWWREVYYLALMIYKDICASIFVKQDSK